MKNMKQVGAQGIKEGWTLFWSPFTGYCKTARRVITTTESAPGVANQFKAGLHEGWTLFWSPFTALVKAATSILTKK